MLTRKRKKVKRSPIIDVTRDEMQRKEEKFEPEYRDTHKKLKLHTHTQILYDKRVYHH